MQGRCEKPPNESPAIAQLQLNEELPPNACVIEVEEDFMELPLRQGRGATELWLHNFYIVTHRPRLTPDDSATTILHKDGALYITNTVFQGRDYFNRAIDMSSSDGGSPLLFVKGAQSLLYLCYRYLEPAHTILWMSSSRILKRTGCDDCGVASYRV